MLCDVKRGIEEFVKIKRDKNSVYKHQFNALRLYILP